PSTPHSLSLLDALPIYSLNSCASLFVSSIRCPHSPLPIFLVPFNTLSIDFWICCDRKRIIHNPSNADTTYPRINILTIPLNGAYIFSLFFSPMINQRSSFTHT